MRVCTCRRKRARSTHNTEKKRRLAREKDEEVEEVEEERQEEAENGLEDGGGVSEDERTRGEVGEEQ